MSVDAGERPASAWVRPAAMAAGALLVAAAIVVVVRQRGALDAAMAAMKRPQPGMVAMLLAGVAANVVLTALCLRILIARFGRVGALEMQALVATATLLNYLPLRPGLLGRVAWHRARNGIAATATVRTLIEATLISAAIAGAMAAALLLWRYAGIALWAGVALPGVLLVAAAAAVPAWRRLSLAGIVRYAEVLVWALRYHAAFALIGSPIDAGTALALACVGMVAMLVPLVGNGLGVREWAVGLAASRLAGGVLELGLTADLVNRAAELVVVSVLGLLGAGWLARARSR